MPPNGAPTSLNSLEVVDQASESTEDFDRTKQQHFRTDHLMGDLAGRAVRGGAFTVASQCFKFVLQMGSTMVLARLLTPSDFGLIAMVAAFTGVVALFKDLGLSLATIQREKINHEQVSTLFWINVAVSFVLVIIVAAMAPAVAGFYAEPKLVWITIAIAGTFIFGGLSAQHTALIRRQMRFKAMAFIEIGSQIVAIATGIVFAWRGAAYWSLVAMEGARVLAFTGLSWISSGWLPGKPVRSSDVRPMIAFGGNAVGASLVDYVGSTLDRVLIGWGMGSTALGMYSKAFGLLTLPLHQLAMPLSSVAVPAMSRAASQPTKYRAAYLSATSQLVCISAPLVMFLIVFSKDVINVLLGPGWNEAAGLFAILGFAGCILPFWNSTGWIWVSQGRMREHLHFHMIASFVRVMLICAGLYWGAQGVALGVVVHYYVMIPVLFYMLGRSGPIRQHDLYVVLVWPCAVTVTVGLALFNLRQLLASYGMMSRLTSGLLVFALVWLVLHFAFPSGRRVLASYRESIGKLTVRQESQPGNDEA